MSDTRPKQQVTFESLDQFAAHWKEYEPIYLIQAKTFSDVFVEWFELDEIMEPWFAMIRKYKNIDPPEDPLNVEAIVRQILKIKQHRHETEIH